MKMDRKKQKKFQGIHLLLRTLKRVISRDEEYIQKVLWLEENPDHLVIRHNGTTDYGKVIYIIKENCDHDGFCATLRFIICYLIFAEQHGFVPKIKLTENFIYYDKSMNEEIKNPWEYYFVADENSCDESKALNICYARYDQMKFIREKYAINAYKKDDYYNEETIKICSSIIRKYLVLKPAIVNEAKALVYSIDNSNRKILGVHIRGTDYKQGYDGHPIYIDAEQVLAEIRKALKTGRFDAIFLATDDKSVLKKIKESLRNIELLIHAGVYRSEGSKSVAFSESRRKYHHYLLGYEIVRDMYTLSMCDGLVAGKSSVSYMSNLYKRSRNEKYEYMQIIDNGNYTSDKPFVHRP